MAGLANDNLISNYDPDLIVLTLFKSGHVVSRIRLDDLSSPADLEPTASHLHWGDYVGMGPDDIYWIVLPPKYRWFGFDAKTGRLLRGVKPPAFSKIRP